MPRLSVITVTYNAGEVLEKTLQSIFEQSFDDYELIIIDGKSTDSTLEIIQNHSDNIHYWISEPDSGIYDAMNKGLAVASGEFIQFLNAGDFYCDNRVLSDIFTDVDDKPTLLYGDIQILKTDGTYSYQTASEFTLDNLLERGTGVLCHQAMFVRRSQAPYYDCKYKFKAELNWYFDLVELPGFTFKHIARPVVYYALGGFGYKYFLRNRLDWIRLIYRRYGIGTVYRSRILLFLLNNAISRYRLRYNPIKFFKRAGSIFRRT